MVCTAIILGNIAREFDLMSGCSLLRTEVSTSGTIASFSQATWYLRRYDIRVTGRALFLIRHSVSG